MGEVERQVVVAERAKPLRPSNSGAFRVVHAGEDATGATDCNAEKPLNPAPVQACGKVQSGVRRDARARCAAAFRAASDRLGLSAAEIAAAIDESRQRVADFMSGARPITMDHAYLIGTRLPALLAAYGEELFQSR